MSITSADLVTYLKTNRLHSEAASYLYIEKSATLGRDEMKSAELWMMGRFYSAGRIAEFNTWRALIYGLDSTDLTNLDAVQTALGTAGSTDPDLHTMLFDGMINIARAKIFSASGQYGTADQWMDEAEEIISALLGKNADPDSVIDQGGVAIAVVDVATEDEDIELIGNY